jgi:hypothetical protein
LDPSKEAEAIATAAIDRDVQSHARLVRLGALAIGLLCLVATPVLLLVLDRLFYWMPVIGVIHIGIAFFYNSRAEARNRLKQGTDLSKYL